MNNALLEEIIKNREQRVEAFTKEQVPLQQQFKVLKDKFDKDMEGFTDALTKIITIDFEKYNHLYVGIIEDLVEGSCGESSYNDAVKEFIKTFTGYDYWENEPTRAYLHYSDYLENLEKELLKY